MTATVPLFPNSWPVFVVETDREEVFDGRQVHDGRRLRLPLYRLHGPLGRQVHRLPRAEAVLWRGVRASLCAGHMAATLEGEPMQTNHGAFVNIQWPAPVDITIRLSNDQHIIKCR